MRRLLAVLALSGGVAAQDYPTRTVKIIVPFPPGGTADAMPRIVAEFLARKWGQAVIIENRAGAGGNVGGGGRLSSPIRTATRCSRRRRRRSSSTRTSIAKLPFDPAQFIPLAVMGKVPNAILTNSPQAEGRENRRRLRRLCQGASGRAQLRRRRASAPPSHLTSELFAQMAGVKFQHIHYRGSAPAVQDLVAGNIDVAFDNVGAAGALIQGRHDPGARARHREADGVASRACRP